LNKQVKNLAFYSALSHKAQSNSIVVVEDINLDTPKTSEFNTILQNLKLAGTKTLYLLPEYNDNTFLSTRNIQRIKTNVFDNANTYDVVNASKLLISESVVKGFNETDEALA
jgi:large subunit ribosomal protein L4